MIGFPWRRAVAALFFLIANGAAAAPVGGHPRLWIDANDVQRLRGWAVATNPVWQSGLRQLAQTAASRMDQGQIPGQDNGGSTYSPVNAEAYAALFAFLANVDPDAAARAAWAQRARTLFLGVIDRVDGCLRATPPVATAPYCQLSFSVSDRSRWNGAAFPLAFDWLQAATLAGGVPALDAAERARVRRVFIWWSYLNMEAYPNPYNNPPTFSLPVGTTGEALLRQPQDARRYRIRYSGNNYFAGHMRQLGMMAIALDPDDDVADPLSPAQYLKLNGNGVPQLYPFDDADGRLRGFLGHALDGWLYMQDHLLRNEGRGGLPAEGLEYAPTSIGIPAQFLYALETAGLGDLEAQSAHGERVAALSTNAFYRALVPGYVHSLSPVPFANPNRGVVYWPAWYGDGEFYYQGDSMNILGPLALHAQRIGDARTVDAIRWLQRHVPPGGSAQLLSRARNQEDILESIMYFLVYDPDAASSGTGAPDPRPSYGTSFWSDGLHRLLSRTDWTAQARWFTFKLGWNSVDHQHGDGLMIELYRRGEWLTKSAMGYGLEGGASDYKNTLTVENTQWAGENPESFRARMLRRGAQMPQNGGFADPVMGPHSDTSTYTYASGDATNLYNAYYAPGDQTPVASRADDVAHVSRSVLWLKPDHVVAYDRARTSVAGRAKRFWLNLPDRLPAVPAIAGDVATSTTPGGQRLFVSSVLPAAKTLAIVTTDPEINLVRNNLWSLGEEDPILQERQYVDPGTGLPVPNQFENFATRLRIEATGAPDDVRFLTVLQGTDAGGVRDATTAVASIPVAGCALPAGGYEGVVIGATRVALFRRDLEESAQCLQYSVPTTASEHFVTGLEPYGAYSVSRTVQGPNQIVAVTPGGALRADAGGVLRFDPSAIVATSLAVASVASVDFGVVAVGATASRTLEIANRGGTALTLASVALDGAGNGYALAGGCTTPGLVLAPDAACALEVAFAPTAHGYRGANIMIASDSATAVAPIAVHGVGEVTSLPLDGVFANGFE